MPWLNSAAAMVTGRFLRWPGSTALWLVIAGARLFEEEVVVAAALGKSVTERFVHPSSLLEQLDFKSCLRPILQVRAFLQDPSERRATRRH